MKITIMYEIAHETPIAKRLLDPLMRVANAEVQRVYSEHPELNGYQTNSNYTTNSTFTYSYLDPSRPNMKTTIDGSGAIVRFSIPLPSSAEERVFRRSFKEIDDYMFSQLRMPIFAIELESPYGTATIANFFEFPYRGQFHEAELLVVPKTRRLYVVWEVGAFGFIWGKTDRLASTLDLLNAKILVRTLQPVIGLGPLSPATLKLEFQQTTLTGSNCVDVTSTDTTKRTLSDSRGPRSSISHKWTLTER